MSSPTPLLPGIPDRYEVLEILGEGAFGTVYSARDRALNRRVAIKLARNTEPRFIERLQREAQALQRLSHPGIAHLLDVFVTEAGRIGLVYELIEGRDVARLLHERGALPPAECRAIVLKLLDTLRSLHERGSSTATSSRPTYSSPPMAASS